MSHTRLIAEALGELLSASRAAMKPTDPATPGVRLRTFWFAKEVSWPYSSSGSASLESMDVSGSSVHLGWGGNDAARCIYQQCGGQPRKVLRALRRIQAATAWCLARAEGRKRAAQEILRQQAKAMEILEAEVVLKKLAK